MSDKLVVAHVSTLHQRDDPRILGKELRALAARFEGDFYYFVNDGLGSESQEKSNISVVDLNMSVNSRLRRMILVQLSMVKKVKKVNPSIVHFHDPELIFLGLIFKLLGAKVIYDVHEDVPRQILSKEWIHVLFRSPLSQIVDCFESLVVRVFDGVVCATDTIRNRFKNVRSITSRNFPVLSELENLKNTKEDYICRSPSFAYIGGLLAIRGAREMVNAIERLENNDATLIIAGLFPNKSLENEVTKFHGWSKVRFLGWVGRKQVRDTLAKCRAGLVVLHPTINYVDALPVKLFEYMSAGLPVIASDFPIWREIVDGCECGILVDPLNIDEISNAMRKILENPDQAFEMGSRGRAAVLAKYNWEAESVKLIDFYNDLLSLN